MIAPRVLGGFAVIPTGSTLLRDVPDPEIRAEIIRRCRMALDVLEEGLVDARDDTANELHRTRGLSWNQIARLFRVSNRRETLHAQPDAAVIFHATIRRGTRRQVETSRRERARRAA